MTDLLSASAVDRLLFLAIPLGSDRDNGRKIIREAYAAALARVAELEDEKRDRIWGLLGDNHHNANLCPHCQEPLAKSREETRALAAELAELRAAVTESLDHTHLGADEPVCDLCEIQIELRHVLAAHAAIDGAQP